jgi:hypothetical protein
VQPFDVEVTGTEGDVRHFRASELLAVRVAEINRWRPGGDLCSSRLRMASVPETTRMGLPHAIIHALITREQNGSGNTGAFGLPHAFYEDAAEIVCRPAEGFSYSTPLLVEADGEVIGVERARFRMAKKQLRLLQPGGC